jgi:hypothetical protein
MTKINELKEVRSKIRDLSLNLGDLVNILENEMIEEPAKAIIEEQA